MILWTVLTAMCCAAAVLVTIPLVRRYEAKVGEQRPEIETYRNQLKEIEREKETGQIGAQEADVAKAEVQRRMLAAIKPADTERPVSPRWRAIALAAAAGFVILGAANIYGVLGRPDLPSASVAADAGAVAKLESQSAGNVDDMIGKLAQRLGQEPGNAEGWRMLGWSYFNTQRYAEAVGAYGKAVELEPGNADYQSAYAEAMVQSAGGVVTPSAQAIFESVLRSDPKEARSRFYMALAREQAGDLGQALDMWIALLNDAPKDVGWLVDVRQRIAELGAKTGRDVTTLTASIPVTPAGNGDDAVAGADQQAMIRGMVDGLAEKLKASPHDAEGWKRLIRSRVVLNEKQLAQEALRAALTEFSGDAAASKEIAALGRELGVAVE